MLPCFFGRLVYTSCVLFSPFLGVSNTCSYLTIKINKDLFLQGNKNISIIIHNNLLPKKTIYKMGI